MTTADALLQSDLKSLPFLHRGKVLATGRAVDIIAEFGASNIGDAFTRITGADEEKISA